MWDVAAAECALGISGSVLGRLSFFLGVLPMFAVWQSCMFLQRLLHKT